MIQKKKKKKKKGAIIAFNKGPFRELQNDNDQGQRNASAGALSKYAHFSTWKISGYISIIYQKNTTIFLEVEMNSCV